MIDEKLHRHFRITFFVIAYFQFNIAESDHVIQNYLSWMKGDLGQIKSVIVSFPPWAHFVYFFSHKNVAQNTEFISNWIYDTTLVK